MKIKEEPGRGAYGALETAVPQRWLHWLLAVSTAGTLGGFLLALGTFFYEPALDAVYAFVFGPEAAAELTAADRVLFNVTIAIGGGLQAGASALIGFMTYFPLRRGERWAWTACVVALLLWLGLDTGLTTWYLLNGYPKLWPKVANDLTFVFMFGIPYAALYRHCRL